MRIYSLQNKMAHCTQPKVYSKILLVTLRTEIYKFTFFSQNNHSKTKGLKNIFE